MKEDPLLRAMVSQLKDKLQRETRRERGKQTREGRVLCTLEGGYVTAEPFRPSQSAKCHAYIRHMSPIGRQCPQYGERGHSAAGSTQMTMKS